tara:strand:- start:15777 stop:15962 length:186 start_codon:yes stop_codon:yes gene_type:complete
MMFAWRILERRGGYEYSEHGKKLKIVRVDQLFSQGKKPVAIGAWVFWYIADRICLLINSII